MGGLPVSDKALALDTDPYETSIQNLDKQDIDLYAAKKESASAKGEIAGLAEQQKQAGEKARLSRLEQGMADYKKAVQDSPLTKQLDEVIEKRSRQFVPTQDTQKDLTNLFTLTTVIGFALGGAGKSHAQQALSAMNGMLEGHLKGRDDQYKREKDVFDENAKALDKLVTVLQSKKGDVLELAKTDYQSAQLEAERLSLEAGAPFAAEIARKQGVVKWGEYADNMLQLNEKSRSALLRARESALNREQRERSQAELREIQRQGLVMREMMMEQKHANQYGGESGLVKQFTGAELKDKEAEQVVLNAKSMAEADSLKKYVLQNADVIGRPGQFKSVFERYVDSLGTGTPYNPSDPEEQKALVFAKRYAAYLTTYERGIAGGARGFTVSLQNRFNKLLTQDQFNPTGFANLMDQQMQEMATGATSHDQRIDYTKTLRLGQDILQRGTAPSEVVPAAPVGAPTQPVDPLGIR
jgi:hypothetical protein